MGAISIFPAGDAMVHDVRLEALRRVDSMMTDLSMLARWAALECRPDGVAPSPNILWRSGRPTTTN